MERRWLRVARLLHVIGELSHEEPGDGWSARRWVVGPGTPRGQCSGCPWWGVGTQLRPGKTQPKLW